MESILSILAPMILVVIGYSIGSTKIITQGNQALVERLGKFHKKLEPGLNYIIPFIDRVAVEDTIREQVLDIPAQQAITKDNISVEVDAVVFWKVQDLMKAYYNVEDVERAIEELVTTTLRSTIGELELDQTYSSRRDINQNLLEQLNEAATDWGVKVIRVEVQELKPPADVLESLAKARAAETQKQAEIFKAQGTVESIEMLSRALLEQPNSKAVLQYLIAQRYVDANQKLGESPNSKVVFMDPKALSEAITDLIGAGDSPIDGFANGSSIRPHDQ
ncbi:SPFH domain-containing protein [Allocoleopsis franciscana]|uniref:Membrane protease subunit, stomatin/prohibitin n=1 Tax=Allocoleopsis franciscana PCC 7113 TaxID=1173027 RepID=K9WDX0_9CYAN|nr:stomatin-like protein [Allocoleopsis franciscana]AFZ18001.1 membrane protease subunit, stomatin/prohibitin [Allocoleopsis franciscana PCC 7113]